MTKKGTKPKQSHPQQNFAQLVAIEVEKQVSGVISYKVQALENRLQQMIFQISKFNALRMKSLEDYFTEKEKLSADFFDNAALLTEDKLDKYSSKDAAAELGDRVRFSIRDVNNEKDAEQLKIDNINSDPAQLNKAVESGIIGMKAGETKQIETEIEGTKYTYEVEVKLVSSKLVND